MHLIRRVLNSSPKSLEKSSKGSIIYMHCLLSFQQMGKARASTHSWKVWAEMNQK